MVKMFSADDVHAALACKPLVAALRDAFAAAREETPVRNAYSVGTDAEPGHLLTMPSWRRGEAIGVKLVNVFPNNAARGKGAVNAIYVLFDGLTGEPRAIVDGEALTNCRTSAASALASTYLSRPDSRVLLVVGTGHLAPYMAAAHAAVRPIERVLVWGRSQDKASALADKLRADGMKAEPVESLAAAAAEADIISCATTSVVPLVLGRDVRAGTHVDLVGAFTPQMRETDDDLVCKSAVYVDTYGGALAEAGDLKQPIAAGLWSADQVRGDLHELCAGVRPGRTDATQITLFKSVGAAMEDLVAAELVVRLSQST